MTKRIKLVDDVLAGFAVSLSEEDRSKLQWFGKYYVYVLIYPKDTIFYVGKGYRYRILTHLRPSVDNTSPRYRVIHQILESGGEIGMRKFAYFAEEKDAYRIEMLLIDYLKLENLTNNRCGHGKKQSPKPPNPLIKPPIMEITKEQIGERKTIAEAVNATGLDHWRLRYACCMGVIPACQCKKRWYIDTKSEQFQRWCLVLNIYLKLLDSVYALYYVRVRGKSNHGEDHDTSISQNDIETTFATDG